MKLITWTEFFEKFNKINFKKYDLIVAIAKGGLIPASFIQYKLDIPLQIIHINFRDKSHNPLYEEPKLLKDFEKIKDKKILLVDDVSRTGKTLQKAKQILEDNEIDTFLINGNANYSLFEEKECLDMPWKTTIGE